MGTTEVGDLKKELDSMKETVYDPESKTYSKIEANGKLKSLSEDDAKALPKAVKEGLKKNYDAQFTASKEALAGSVGLVGGMKLRSEGDRTTSDKIYSVVTFLSTASALYCLAVAHQATRNANPKSLLGAKTVGNSLAGYLKFSPYVGIIAPVF